ncbi:transporter substrate-binding domain-containing protein [Marinobacteraceae bacterium S3BR75-40.1]
MRWWAIPVIPLLIILALLPVGACSADHNRALPYFSVADVEPWGYAGSNGEPAGLIVDFIHHLSDLSGVEFAEHLRPHSRAILELEEGKADFAVLFATPKSESIGISLGHVVNMRVFVVALAAHDPVESLDDLAGKQVGYIRGTFYGPGFNQHPAIERVAVKNMAQGLEILKYGRLDAMVGTDRALLAGLQKSDVRPEDIRIIMELPPTKGDIYLSRKSNRKDLIEPISRAVDQLNQSGEMERIFEVPGHELIKPLLH